MKLRTKLLIMVSAGLVALSLVACGGGDGQEDKTTPAPDENVTGEASANTQENVGDSNDGGDVDGTVAHDPDDSLPEAGTLNSDAADSNPSESLDSSEDPAVSEGNGDETIGPRPPVVTEAKSESPTEPEVTMPEIEGMETDQDGVIQLPFVPFD